MDFVLIDLMKRGGWVMYPLLACSLVAVGFILERLYALRRDRVAPRPFLNSLGRLLDQGRLKEAFFLCQTGDTAAARLALASLKVTGQPRGLIKEILEEAGRREAGELHAHLNVLGVVVAVAPLLGLLGTVSGMIRAFNTITVEGLSNPALMAAGISEALLTTAAGLIIAIPALVAHRYLLSRADNLVAGLEDFGLYLTETLARQKLGDEAGPPRASALKSPAGDQPLEADEEALAAEGSFRPQMGGEEA